MLTWLPFIPEAKFAQKKRDRQNDNQFNDFTSKLKKAYQKRL
jgi:hypothetical protein